MTITRAQGDRLEAISTRSRGARKRLTELREAAGIARQVGDENTLAQIDAERRQIEYDLQDAGDLERQALRSIAGVSPSYGRTSALDDPAVVRELERLANDETEPIGKLDLGPMMEVNDFCAAIQGDSISGWSSPMASVNPDVPAADRLAPFGGIVPQPRRSLSVLDLCSVQPLDNRSFHYLMEGGTMDADAAEVVEGSIAPAADVTLTDVLLDTKSISAYLKLKRQQLDDLPGLGTTYQARLLYKIRRRLENQVVGGDGVGENIRGILNVTPAVNNVAFASSTPLADLALTGIVNEILADFEADAIAIHPSDWAKILTVKSTTNEYVNLDGPVTLGTTPTLWGLPVIQSKAMTQGTALVGAYAAGATVFVRQAPTLRISDSDQDDFVRQQLTYFATLRAGVAVWQSTAFCTVHLS